MLGLIGGPLIFASSIAVLFDAYDQTDAAHFIPSLPEIGFEASLGIYLIVKGKASPILDDGRYGRVDKSSVTPAGASAS